MTEPIFTKEESLARLAELGEALAVIAEHFVNVLAKRLELAEKVAWTKKHTPSDEYPLGEPIFRPDTERDRLERIAELGERAGLNPNFCRTILYLIIGES